MASKGAAGVRGKQTVTQTSPFHYTLPIPSSSAYRVHAFLAVPSFRVLETSSGVGAIALVEVCQEGLR
eukprot:2970648-Amphidinium_carterae.1